MVHGNNSAAPEAYQGYVGFSMGCERLEIPPLAMNDGPEGFRGPSGTSTQVKTVKRKEKKKGRRDKRSSFFFFFFFLRSSLKERSL